MKRKQAESMCLILRFVKYLVNLYQIERNKIPRKISDKDFWKIAKSSYVDDNVRSIITLKGDLLRLIIIDLKYRGLGYGHKLINYVGDKISWLIIEKPITTNIVSYYERFGFHITEENTDTDIIMKR